MPQGPSAAGRTRRDTDKLQVAASGKVVALDRIPGFCVMDPIDDEFMPATEWLRFLVACDREPTTVRTYASGLLLYLRFLWAIGCRWELATEVETRDFVLWMKSTKKFSGAKRPAVNRPKVNGQTGKRYLSGKYSAATINAALTASRSFYEFHSRDGGPILLNPFPVRAPRSNAHRGPDDPVLHGRRDPYRQKPVKRVPRAIPDDKFNALFRGLTCNRDRALVAIYISSGARAREILMLTCDDIDWGESLVTIRSKGGAVRAVPVAGDALVWLSLYLLERGRPSTLGAPLWLTARGETRPLSYDALRAVMRRVNEMLGTNWTLHDLRHTFAIRALEGGMKPHQVQEILGHASIETLAVYSVPSTDEIIAAHRATFTPNARSGRTSAVTTSSQYNPADLAALWGPGS